tara:strand:+ start:84 stop:788 length:705 start_codon:yes stop_codon:yes gene_type:complete
MTPKQTKRATTMPNETEAVEHIDDTQHAAQDTNDTLTAPAEGNACPTASPYGIFDLSKKLRKHKENNELFKAPMMKTLQVQIGTNGFDALRSAYGLSKYANLDLIVPDKFVPMFQNLDASADASFHEFSRFWFGGKDARREHHPIMKTNEDGERVVTVKVVTEGVRPTKIVNIQQEPVELDHLNRDCKVIVIANLTHMWMMKEEYGTTLYAEKIIVKKGVHVEAQFTAGWEEGW